MKHISKSLLTLLLAGLLGLSGCIKNEASEGLEAIRNAQADLIMARADYQAALSAYVAAETAYRDAQTAALQEDTRSVQLQNDLDAATNANTIALELAELETDLLEEQADLIEAEEALAEATSDLAATLQELADDLIVDALGEYQDLLDDLNDLVADRIDKEYDIAIAELLWIERDIVGTDDNVSWTFYLTYLEGEVMDAEDDLAEAESRLSTLMTWFDDIATLPGEYKALLEDADAIAESIDLMDIDEAKIDANIEEVEEDIALLSDRPVEGVTVGGDIGNYELLSEIVTLHVDLITVLTDGGAIEDLYEDTDVDANGVYEGGNIVIDEFEYYNDFLGVPAGTDAEEWADWITDGLIEFSDDEVESLVELQETIDDATALIAVYQAGLDEATARAEELAAEVAAFEFEAEAQAVLDIQLQLHGLYTDLVAAESEVVLALASGTAAEVTAAKTAQQAVITSIEDITGAAVGASADPDGEPGSGDEETRSLRGLWFDGRADADGLVTEEYSASANPFDRDEVTSPGLGVAPPLSTGTLVASGFYWVGPNGIDDGNTGDDAEGTAFTPAPTPYQNWVNIAASADTDAESAFATLNSVPFMGASYNTVNEHNYLVNENILFLDTDFFAFIDEDGFFTGPVAPIDGYVYGITPSAFDLVFSVDQNSAGYAGNIAAWQYLVDEATDAKEDAEEDLADQNAAIDALNANAAVAVPILDGLLAAYDAAILEETALEAELVSLNMELAVMMDEINDLENQEAWIYDVSEAIEDYLNDGAPFTDPDWGLADLNDEDLESFMTWLEDEIEDLEEDVEEYEQDVREATFNLATATPEMMEDEATIVKLQGELEQINAQIEVQQALVDTWKAKLDELLAGS